MSSIEIFSLPSMLGVDNKAQSLIYLRGFMRPRDIRLPSKSAMEQELIFIVGREKWLRGEDGSLCRCKDPEFRSPDPGKNLAMVCVVMTHGNK